MNADQEQAKARFSGLHAELTERVLSVFYKVYNELGGGFLKGVYHRAMRMALLQAGLKTESEVPVPVMFRGKVVGDYRADLVVEGRILLELKAVAGLDRTHEGQVLHYLRATDFEVALLMNFVPKPQFKRFVLENSNKQIRVDPRSSGVSTLAGDAGWV